jgi:hypothetical protein
VVVLYRQRRPDWPAVFLIPRSASPVMTPLCLGAVVAACVRGAAVETSSTGYPESVSFYRDFNRNDILPRAMVLPLFTISIPL